MTEVVESGHAFNDEYTKSLGSAFIVMVEPIFDEQVSLSPLAYCLLTRALRSQKLPLSFQNLNQNQLDKNIFLISLLSP